MWQTLTGPLCQLVTLLLCACDRFVDMKINMKKKLTLSCFVLFCFFKTHVRETKLAIWEETTSPHFSYSFKDTFMHKIKKQQQQAFFSFFLIIFYCLSLIQALKYEDKKLDLNNASYTNTHAEEREKKYCQEQGIEPALRLLHLTRYV